MKETIKFNSGQSIKIKNELVKGVVLDIKALQADDATVCDINDLNEIPLSIKVHRNGRKEGEAICDDYLDYILRGLFAGTTRYGIATTKRTEGYLIKIPFEGAIDLVGQDYIEIKCKAPVTAFTALEKDNSEITVESVPANKHEGRAVSVVESVNYGSGSDNINEHIGSGIVKMCLVHDLGADYLASIKAKPTEGVTLTASGFSKEPSENILISENIDYHELNPETTVQDLVVYANYQFPLMNAKYKAKYNKAVEIDAKIMLVKRKAI